MSFHPEKRWPRLALLVIAAAMLPGCVGMVVGAATDVAVEVAKVPFKVGGAVIDVANGDEKDEGEEEK